MSPPIPAPIFQPRRQPVQMTIANAMKRTDSEMSIASTPGSGTSTPTILREMPSKRYIGSFGVAAWATKSGSNLLKHDEMIRIERMKPQPKLNKAKKVIQLKKPDIIVRFLNGRGE